MTTANWFVAAILCERPDDYVCGAWVLLGQTPEYALFEFAAPEKSAIKINQIRDIHDFRNIRLNNRSTGS